MYKTKKIKNLSKIFFAFFMVFCLVFSFSTPLSVDAQGNGITGGNSGTGTTPPSSGVKLINPLKWDTLVEFFREILKIAAQIGSIFVVVGFVYTGFLFVKAQGNAEELATAKRSFTYTVIGAALVLGAWAFAMAIAETIKSITS